MLSHPLRQPCIEKQERSMDEPQRARYLQRDYLRESKSAGTIARDHYRRCEDEDCDRESERKEMAGELGGLDGDVEESTVEVGYEDEVLE